MGFFGEFLDEGECIAIDILQTDDEIFDCGLQIEYLNSSELRVNVENQEVNEGN